jgi:vancomycin resistance protein YoaR
MMKRSTAFVGAVLALALAASARAQVKEIPGDMVTVSGTVEAIDHTKRVLTMKNEKGEFTTVDVPADVKRFNEIKVGDTITAKYYDTVSVRLKKPGEAAVNTDTAGKTAATGAKPGTTVASQRTMTAVIEAIDPKIPSITFKGPNGWKYSRRVADKEALKQVKVGDQVDFVWTEAVILEVTAPKK